MVLDEELRREIAHLEELRILDEQRLHKQEHIIEARVSEANAALLDVKLVAQCEIANRVRKEKAQSMMDLDRVKEDLAKEMEGKYSSMMAQFQSRCGEMHCQSSAQLEMAINAVNEQTIKREQAEQEVQNLKFELQKQAALFESERKVQKKNEDSIENLKARLLQRDSQIQALMKRENSTEGSLTSTVAGPQVATLGSIPSALQGEFLCVADRLFISSERRP